MKFLLKNLFLVLILVTAHSIYAQSTDNVTVVQLSQIEGMYENTSLALTPGKYIFEVTNKNVAKKLGFYLTSTTGTKEQVANSGLSKLVAKGESAKTGIVELTEGTYQYSCPLNPTPHYSLTVGTMKDKMADKEMMDKPMEDKMTAKGMEDKMLDKAMKGKEMKDKMNK